MAIEWGEYGESMVIIWRLYGCCMFSHLVDHRSTPFRRPQAGHLSGCTTNARKPSTPGNRMVNGW